MTATKKTWTDDEIDELRRLYPQAPDVDELAARFGVTVTALQGVAYRHNIRREGRSWSSRDTWTDDRVQYLRDHIDTKTAKEIGEHLGVTSQTVRMKAGKLGLSWPETWTDERVAQLRAEYGTVSLRQLAARLGVSVETVSRKAKALDLPAPGPRPLRWTPERVAEFRRLYPTTSNEEMGTRFGLSPKSVTETASRLGARKQTRQTAGAET